MKQNKINKKGCALRDENYVKIKEKLRLEKNVVADQNLYVMMLYPGPHAVINSDVGSFVLRFCSTTRVCAFHVHN